MPDPAAALGFEAEMAAEGTAPGELPDGILVYPAFKDCGVPGRGQDVQIFNGRLSEGCREIRQAGETGVGGKWQEFFHDGDDGPLSFAGYRQIDRRVTLDC